MPARAHRRASRSPGRRSSGAARRCVSCSTFRASADLSHPDARYADGIGLMRTEFLFDDPGRAAVRGGAAPHVYRRCAALGGRPAGDDPHASMPAATSRSAASPTTARRTLSSASAACGSRLRRPEIFAVQLRALARAAVHGQPQGHVADGHRARRIRGGARALSEARWRSCAPQASPRRSPELGIMVEVPAAALTIDALRASFFSIGSNDLDAICHRLRSQQRRARRARRPAQSRRARAHSAERPRTAGGTASASASAATWPAIRAPPRRFSHCGLREFSMSAAVARAGQAGDRWPWRRRAIMADRRCASRARRAPSPPIRASSRRCSRSAPRACASRLAACDGQEPQLHQPDRQSGLSDPDPGAASQHHLRGLPFLAAERKRRFSQPMAAPIRAAPRASATCRASGR